MPWPPLFLKSQAQSIKKELSQSYPLPLSQQLELVFHQHRNDKTQDLVGKRYINCSTLTAISDTLIDRWNNQSKSEPINYSTLYVKSDTSSASRSQCLFINWLPVYVDQHKLHKCRTMSWWYSRISWELSNPSTTFFRPPESIFDPQDTDHNSYENYPSGTY
jgi:hypothetical protein